MLGASALSGHLLNLLSNFTTRTSGSLRACKSYSRRMPSPLNSQAVLKDKPPIPLPHTRPLHAEQRTSSLLQNRFLLLVFIPRSAFPRAIQQVGEVNAINVPHTTVNFTSRAVLFSGIGVKPENGDQKEAELQTGCRPLVARWRETQCSDSTTHATRANKQR